MTEWDDVAGTARQLDLLARDRRAPALPAHERAGDRARRGRRGSSRRSSWRWRCTASPRAAAARDDDRRARCSPTCAAASRPTTATSPSAPSSCAPSSASSASRRCPALRQARGAWRSPRVQRTRRPVGAAHGQAAPRALMAGRARRAARPRARGRRLAGRAAPGAAAAGRARGAARGRGATAPCRSRRCAATADGPLRVAVVVPPFRRGSGGHARSRTSCAGSRRAATAARCGSRTTRAGTPHDADVDALFKEFFGPLAAPGAPRLRRRGAAPTSPSRPAGRPCTARCGCRASPARAYLVQDHEPEFYGTSAERTWARGDLPARACTASARARGWPGWSPTRYGASASPFDLGVDHDAYKPTGGTRRDDLVVAYARAVTPRRAVPLVLLALEELHRRRPARRDRAVRRERADRDAVPAHARAACSRSPALAELYARGDRRRRALDDEPVARADRDARLRAAGRRRRERRDGRDVRRRRADRARGVRPARDRRRDRARCSTTRRCASARGRPASSSSPRRSWRAAAEQVEAGLRAALVALRPTTSPGRSAEQRDQQRRGRAPTGGRGARARRASTRRLDDHRRAEGGDRARRSRSAWPASSGAALVEGQLDVRARDGARRRGGRARSACGRRRRRRRSSGRPSLRRQNRRAAASGGVEVERQQVVVLPRAAGDSARPPRYRPAADSVARERRRRACAGCRSGAARPCRRGRS